MSEWITPDEVKKHFDNGYAAGVAYERKLIVRLLMEEEKHLKQISESIQLDEYMSEDDWQAPLDGAFYIREFTNKLLRMDY